MVRIGIYDQHNSGANSELSSVYPVSAGPELWHPATKLYYTNSVLKTQNTLLEYDIAGHIMPQTGNLNAYKQTQLMAKTDPIDLLTLIRRLVTCPPEPV